MGPADMDEPGPGEGDVPANEGHDDGGAGDGDEVTGPAADDPAADGPAADETAALDSTPADGAPAGQSGGSQAGDQVPVPPGGRRPGRRKKILAWTAGGVAVVLLIAVGGAYGVYRHLNGNLHQLNISSDLGTQPVDTHPQAENIMVIGSDTRHDQGRGFGQDLTTDQSDTLMIMHISADRKWVDVMSIPRDSWVNIPACKMGNGQMSVPDHVQDQRSVRPGQPVRQPHRPRGRVHREDAGAGHRHPHRPLRGGQLRGFPGHGERPRRGRGVQHARRSTTRSRACT